MGHRFEKRGGVNNNLFTSKRCSIPIQFSSEESYSVRPNENEFKRRIAEILSEGVYNFLKKEGLLKEAQNKIGKTSPEITGKLDNFLHEWIQKEKLS